jgi:hypothetical protein
MLRHAGRATFRSNGDLSEMFRPQNFRLAPCAGLQTIGPRCAGFSNPSPKSAPNRAYLASECRRGQGRVASGGTLPASRVYYLATLARPAEHSSPSTIQWIEEGRGAIKWTRLSRQLRRQHGAPLAFMCWLQPLQLHTNAKHGSTTISFPHRHSSCPNWPSVSAREAR